MGACVAAAAKLPIDLGLLPVCRKSLRRTADLLDSWPRGDIVRHIVTMD